MTLWGFLVLAAKVSWVIFLVLNLLNKEHFEREAANNYFRLTNAKVMGQYIGAFIQAAWLYGGGTWLFFGWRAGLAAFALFAGFLFHCTLRGVEAGRAIERLEKAAPW